MYFFFILLFGFIFSLFVVYFCDQWRTYCAICLRKGRENTAGLDLLEDFHLDFIFVPKWCYFSLFFLFCSFVSWIWMINTGMSKGKGKGLLLCVDPLNQSWTEAKKAESIYQVRGSRQVEADWWRSTDLSCVRGRGVWVVSGRL